MGTNDMMEEIKKAYFEGCANYHPGPGGFSCLNFRKESYAGSEDDVREAGLRNPIERDTLCARCSNHKEK